MKIAQIAPLIESVPPKLYGGTERIVSYLTEELVELGHEVTLFASGDSTTRAVLHAVAPRALRLDPSVRDPTAYQALMLEQVSQAAPHFDVVHFHVDWLHFPLFRRINVPCVSTLHGRLDLPELEPLFGEFLEMPVISVSDAQRRPLPWPNWIGTVHHGLPEKLLTPRGGEQAYLAFLGRIAPEKRPDLAIRLAVESGWPLKIAAKVDKADQAYFETVVRPLLGAPGVDYIGEIDETRKADFLSKAAALLFPVDWPEPFGLVMIEAFACGTPVIAFDRGSVPEVVESGVTGFIVDGPAEAIGAITRIGTLDRMRIRHEFERRFTSRRMAEDYLASLPPALPAAGAQPGGCLRTTMPKPNASRSSGEAQIPSGAENVSPFYIPSTASTRSDRSRTLKHRDTFIVVDAAGDAQAAAPASEGLFHHDTRFLSRLLLLIAGERPLLLSSAVTRDNAMLTTDMTNPDLYDGGRLALARDMVHLLRCKVLCDGACFEQVAIRNYADHAVSFTLSIAFAADFADIFEVRGQRRQRRGELLAPEIDGTTAILGYLGRDGVKRRTHFCFAETPSSLSEHEARYVLSLPPGGSTTLHLTFRCEVDGVIAAPDATFMSCRANAAALARQRRATGARIHSSNAAFNAWIERSRADLDMLITQKETGPYPYAGIPWFSTAFGRDAIVTALECLWIRPELARGCLGFLAATQATDISPEADAQPGKILHETRGGEMAALGEVPFKRYYGSVDSTPLFVVLAAAYYERTGDIDFIRSIWPNINAALQWMSQYGDPDGDGFLEYGTTAERGLTNQGWKDSSDSIFHADGRLAKAPIALVEVQAYAYAAWRGAAVMAEALGEKPRHDALMRQATELAHRFETTYWCDEINSYALALDADKKPCRVRSSNAGHALFAGIASPERAKRVAATLMDPTSFSEWGIRTVATSEARYNPMSYHNGSVWPHDNGLIALGFAHYGLRQPLLKIMGGLYDAAAAVELHRLPELFCGFPRRKGEGPTAYPVACNPQAWASASAFALLGAVLGVSFHPGARQIRFTRPVLPPFLEEIRLERLGMGEVSVDLLFHRHVRDAALVVLHKEGRADIVLVSG